MRFERFPRTCSWLLVVAALLVTSSVLFAQETTAGLQGTVKTRRARSYRTPAWK